jgi:thymidine kinase
MVLEVVSGCMFSGKTSYLLQTVNRAVQQEKTYSAYTPSIDTRYGSGTIGSHDDQSLSAYPLTEDTAEELYSAEADVILVDEANFLQPSAVSTILEVAESKHIVAAGLDTDFRNEPFEPVPTLINNAQRTVFKQAVCEICGEPATKTQRIIDGEPAHYSDPVVDVGGSEKYEARCESCHEVQFK